MSTIIDTEIVIMNEVLKKSFPSKHLKYLSYALYIMKQVYPDHDTCVEKFVEHLHLTESIEFVMNEIDTSITPELENEVREIKRNLNKKPKRKRAPPAKKGSVSVPVEENITEQIVTLASEPIIQRGPIEPSVEPVKKTKRKGKKDPERPSPAFVPIPSHNLVEKKHVKELPKEEVIVQVEEPKEELPAQVEETKKTKVTKTKVKKDEVVATTTEKKVAKAKVPRVAKAKAPTTIEEPAPFTEELVEEPEQ